MTDTPENRSEIVLLYDAEDTNPNGDPLSSNNQPRVDNETQQAVVTDVRLKRYIRDQLDDDGHGIYIRNPSKAARIPGSRDDLFMQLLGHDDQEDVEEFFEDEEDPFGAFCEQAADVRYFGATFSFSETVEEAMDEVDVRPPQLTGPVQFTHGRSMNAVVPKQESKKLSTVVTSGGDAEQGTFAEDNRLEYALVKFHGVINENAAERTRLTVEDVEALDNVVWRSLKNQTLTRSKMGHSPRLYLRVEFEEGYHQGTLDDDIAIHRPSSEEDVDMRNISDVTLDVTGLIETLNEVEDHVNRIVLKGSKYVDVAYNDGDDVHTDDVSLLHEELADVAPVETPDVYEG